MSKPEKACGWLVPSISSKLTYLIPRKNFLSRNVNALVEKSFHVSDLASMPAVKSRDKHSHRSKYYPPMTAESMRQNLESEFGLPSSIHGSSFG